MPRKTMKPEFIIGDRVTISSTPILVIPKKVYIISGIYTRDNGDIMYSIKEDGTAMQSTLHSTGAEAILLYHQVHLVSVKEDSLITKKFRYSIGEVVNCKGYHATVTISEQVQDSRRHSSYMVWIDDPYSKYHNGNGNGKKRIKVPESKLYYGKISIPNGTKIYPDSSSFSKIKEMTVQGHLKIGTKVAYSVKPMYIIGSTGKIILHINDFHIYNKDGKYWCRTAAAELSKY